MNFGNLEEFSAFAFENYMQSLKKLVKGTKLQLQQVCNRVSEIDNFYAVSCPTKKSGFVQHSKFSKYWYKNVLLATTEGNNCFLSYAGDVLVLVNIEDTKLLSFEFF